MTLLDSPELSGPPNWWRKTAIPLAFTLVELIVVITILAILGTIGFLSLQGYSSSARDSARLSDLANLSKAMDAQLAAGKLLPQPNAPVLTLTASGTTIGYQGCAGSGVLGSLGLSPSMDDPLNGTCYTYETNAAQNKYQVLSLQESASQATALSPFVDEAYAGAYDTRVPSTRGNQLGILLGTWANLNQPAQEYASFTGLDLAKTTTGSGYSMVFSNSDTTASSSGTLFSFAYSRRADLLADRTLAAADPSLVGYWDMETLTGGLLKDLSGNGNHGSINGLVTIWTVRGKLWNATQFTWSWWGIIVVPRSALLEPSALTVCLYASRIGTSGTTWANPVYKEDWPNKLWYNFVLNDQGQAVWRTLGNSNNYDLTIAVPNIGQMNFYCNTYSSGTNKAYVNWNLVNTATGITMWAATTKSLTIGGSSVGYALNGVIDEVRIYNRALSDSEIQALYSAIK